MPSPPPRPRDSIANEIEKLKKLLLWLKKK